MNRSLWVVVPAAGSGDRMGEKLPKQYLMIGQQCMLQHTLERLCCVPDVDGIVVSLAPDDKHFAELPAAHDARIHAIHGGSTRADSVRAGLVHVMNHAPDDSWVLVHDAARPLIQTSDIKRLTDAVFNSGAVGGILGSPVHDTLKKADDYCCIEGTISRQRLWQAQTPQLFRAADLLEALQTAEQANADDAAEQVTDESSAMERLGHEPLLVEALQPNLKITRPVDMQIARALLQQPTPVS